MIIVALPTANIHSWLEALNRMRRYTPAVTSVDECTRALTGVGAAIAEGSQEENGIWALLVIEVRRSKISKKCVQEPICLDNRHIPKITRRKQSPRRLVSAVIIPEPRDFRFL